MRIRHFFLFAGVAIAAASLFASCDPQDKIEGQEEQEQEQEQNQESRIELKEGTIREHSFSRGEQWRLFLELSDDESQLFQKSDSFSINLFKKVSESKGEENFCISPLSLQVTLGMVANALVEESYAELSEALFGEYVDKSLLNSSYGRLKSALEETNCMKLSNAIWMQEGLSYKESFLEGARNYCEPGFLDFRSDMQASYDSICQWAYDNTYGKLRELDLGDLNVEPTFVMTNAAWFSSAWDFPFYADSTKDGEFKLADGRTQTVKMMKAKSGNEIYAYCNTSLDKYIVVSLLFNKGSFRMDMFVPKGDQTIDSIIGDIDWSVPYASTRKINLSMPRFSINTDIRLRSVLEELGMIGVFARTLDMANITGTNEFELIYVNQDLKIDVMEKGVEAAVATSAVGTWSLSMPVNVTIDRPFIFAIRDNVSDSFLFMGRVNSINQN